MPVYRFASNSVVIADGQTTSGALKIDGVRVYGVYLPSGFEGTFLQFKACDELDGTYLSVQGVDGQLVQYTVAGGRFVLIDPTLLTGVSYIKLVGDVQTGEVTCRIVSFPINNPMP